MLKTLIYMILAGLISSSLWAQRPTKKVSSNRPVPIIFNLGTHTEFVGFIQKNENAGLNALDINPVIGAGIQMPMSGDFTFIPEINWVLPFRGGSSKLMKNLFMLRADIAYTPWDYIRARFGTSIMWQNMHGSGGSVQMNNGNDTSTFYNPNENHSSLNNTLDFGLEVLTGSPWSFRLQTYVYSILKEEKRQLSYSLFVSYAWENK